MSESDNPVEVQVEAPGKIRKVIDAGCDVLECGRPPAVAGSAVTASAPVLQVPYGEALQHKVLGHRDAEACRVFVAPIPAMNNDDRSTGESCRRQIQVAPLVRMRPVGKPDWFLLILPAGQISLLE
jgi:hypothetical protein